MCHNKSSPVWDKSATCTMKVAHSELLLLVVVRLERRKGSVTRKTREVGGINWEWKVDRREDALLLVLFG